MRDYYRNHLHSDLLKRCYDLAPPRIRQYLAAEVEYVAERIRPDCSVLELGCGYGRVLQRLAMKAGFTVGIDTSPVNIECAVRSIKDAVNCHMLLMDAANIGFTDSTFDCVVCIQNGISAFHVDRKILIRESVRATKESGVVFFSSYSPRIWHDRLRWFELQSRAGVIGEIDQEKTRDGTIVCKDGFTATTVSPEEFRGLVEGIPAELRIEEVDGSSMFFVLTVHGKRREHHRVP
ncbi:class I SAM-dependent methyltransferase [candidate division WOR-3 bacterium]|nr:class I SAM-dependent methyltransferase [candidate division WOR-3 bacterium]